MTYINKYIIIPIARIVNINNPHVINISSSIIPISSAYALFGAIFIFSSTKTGGVDSKIIVLPFNHNMEVQEISKECKLNTTVQVALQDYIIMPDESIDIKIDLNFSLDICKNADINLINNIDIQENNNEDPHSIIIYYVKPGDTIWQIAKKFKSTVADITKMNGIENENTVNVGEQLFIPRYVPEVATGNA